MTHYHFFQLPRGDNQGGPIHHTLATMQKYASLTEDQVNNQSYSLVFEHLERLSKENEEMEKIRKK